MYENQEEVDNLVRKVLEERYDHTAPVPPTPNWSISIGGKGISLPASLIGVYGPPKSRKSTFLGMIAAAALSPKKTLGHIVANIKGDIIWFDTEQNETEVKYFQDNIVRLSENTDDDDISDRYHCYKLRPYEENQRLEIIDRILMAKDSPIKPGLIILDGVADLMYNVNEIDASKKLVTKLTNWADELQVPLFVALHTNKDGKDATGSLGGFINKKASYTIKCQPEFENGPSVIRPYYIRNGQNFEPFKIFNHDEDSNTPGLPMFYEEEEETLGDWVNNHKTKSRKETDSII